VLKKTILMVAVLASFAALAAIPAASATAASKPAATAVACPPGTASARYCEPHCIVPRLYGNGLLGAIIKIHVAGCRLGAIFFYYRPTPKTPKLIPANYHLFTVVWQHPLPGVIRPYHAKVAVWVVVNF